MLKELLKVGIKKRSFSSVNIPRGVRHGQKDYTIMNIFTSLGIYLAELFFFIPYYFVQSFIRYFQHVKMFSPFALLFYMLPFEMFDCSVGRGKLLAKMLLLLFYYSGEDQA